MSESMLQLVSGLKLIWVAGFACLYGIGGMRHKWLRRVVGSIYLTLGICLFSLWVGSFSYWFLGFAPLLWGALSIGYGADELYAKLIKRARYGLAVGFASLPVAIGLSFMGSHSVWFLFFAHCVICSFASVVFGVVNPISARGEETAIGTVSGFIPMFYFG